MKINFMTKTEARKILKAHNEWRRGGDGDMESPRLIGEAIDVLCESPSISQALRDAAVNWPQFLNDEDCSCLYGFLGDSWTKQGYEEHSNFWRCFYYGNKFQSINFMLFVAEALE